MSLQQIPEMYKTDDMVYHYTSSETALLHILKDMRLRLRLRSESNDPIENTEHFYSINNDNEMGDLEKAVQLKDEAKLFLENTKQISFCKNNSIENVNGLMILPYEKYGFAKPRMWDQYGDKYKGVCLAFSLEALKKEAETNDFIGSDLQYLTYSRSESTHQSINAGRIRTDGYEEYKKFYMNYLKRRLFNKHQDYINENEYRFCSFNANRYDYIDITKCLRGIFISNLSLNPYLSSAFSDVIDMTMDIQFISFRNFSISIQDNKEKVKLQKIIDRYFIEIEKK